MSTLHIRELFTSSHRGWDEIGVIHPSVVKLFVFLVIPLSLVPPMMLEYVGRNGVLGNLPYGGAQNWNATVVAFYLAELLSVPLMAWGIRTMAAIREYTCDYHDAFTLAAIAPVPLWLSALGLFSGSQAISVGVALLGLVASVILIFRGVEGILRVKEDVVAFDIAYRVTALGVSAWIAFILLGLSPLFPTAG